MESDKTIFLFAGEASGDIHGAALAKSLRTKYPNVKLFGVCGPKMRDEGVLPIYHSEEFAVMGLTAVLKRLPKLYVRFYKILNVLLESKPDVIVLIDYPYFNIRMAEALRKKGYCGKICHYICPSVWAHGKERIERIANNYDLLLTIFPFEKDLFSHTNLQVEYIGNPLAEQVQNYEHKLNWHEECGIDKKQPLISLFPGSRQSEIKRNFPKMLVTAALLKKQQPDVRFAVSCSTPFAEEFLDKQKKKHFSSDIDSIIPISNGTNYDLMRHSHCALAKSGTVTLELALHKCPTVVIYEMSAFNRFFAKNILKLNLKHYSLANIVAGCEVFPERIVEGANPHDLSVLLHRMLKDEKVRETYNEKCRHIESVLSTKGSSEKAANAILRISRQ